VSKIGAVLVAIALMAVCATPAAAEYYYTKHGAESVTLDAMHKKYGYSRYESGATCRPQGLSSDNSAFKYHRWVCAWATPAKGRCENGDRWILGDMLIVGRSTPGGYYFKVTHGTYCSDHL
jgi:hypothetical protein